MQGWACLEGGGPETIGVTAGLVPPTFRHPPWRWRGCGLALSGASMQIWVLDTMRWRETLVRGELRGFCVEVFPCLPGLVRVFNGRGGVWGLALAPL